MGKDLIIGVVDNYDWDKIKYWANSIEQSGFDGYKALIVYNMDSATSKKLTTKDFILVGCNKYDDEKGFSFENKGSIMVDRFFHIYNFLNMLQDPDHVKRVIITDVRDVIFQSDPSQWLDTYLGNSYDLVVGSENLLYSGEPWSKNNMIQSFGEYFYSYKEHDPIYCAGVIAGSLDMMKDICLNLWMICLGLNPHVPGGGGPDQSALNIMLTFGNIMYSTLFTNSPSGWVVHAGTTLNAIRAGSGGIGEEYLKNPNMEIDFIQEVDYSITNEIIHANDMPLTIVHQWDRVPEWKILVEDKYND